MATSGSLVDAAAQSITDRLAERLDTSVTRAPASPVFPVAEFVDLGLDLLASWPASIPNGPVTDLLTTLHSLRGDDAPASEEDIDLAAIRLRALLGRIETQLRRSRAEDPAEALASLDADLDGWGPQELAELLGTQPRVLTTWRSGATPRKASRERLAVVAELVTALRTTMTARGVALWLRNPLPQLGGESPMELLDQDLDRARTELMDLVSGGLR